VDFEVEDGVCHLYSSVQWSSYTLDTCEDVVSQFLLKMKLAA